MGKLCLQLKIALKIAAREIQKEKIITKKLEHKNSAKLKSKSKSV